MQCAFYPWSAACVLFLVCSLRFITCLQSAFYSWSAVCVLSLFCSLRFITGLQSSFYHWSAVCVLSLVCSLRFIPGLQSAFYHWSACSLRFILTTSVFCNFGSFALFLLVTHTSSLCCPREDCPTYPESIHSVCRGRSGICCHISMISRWWYLTIKKLGQSKRNRKLFRRALCKLFTSSRPNVFFLSYDMNRTLHAF